MIYLAGKVGGKKWDIFTKEEVERYGIVASDGGNHSEHEFGDALWSWDHDHYSREIKDLCIEKLHGCKYLVAYLDTPDSFGSIAEIAYVNALKKPCYLFIVDPHEGWCQDCAMFDAYWFIAFFPDVSFEICESFEDAKKRMRRLVINPKQAYQEYLSSLRWRELRRQALQKAGLRCQICNSDGELHVHHRSYAQLRTDAEVKDLIVLCRRCHEKYHEVKP